MLLGLVCLMPVLQVQAANTITGSFELSVSRGSVAEVSSGVIYCVQNESLKLAVTSPENQWMFFEGDTLKIYYPNTNSGLRIPTITGKVTLPVFQLAVNAGTEDAGLVEAGYQLKATTVSGDSIIAVWASPEIARNVLGDLTSVYIQDSLMSIVGTNADGDIILQQSYSDWVVHKGRLFPCRVISRNTGGDIELTESIIFENVIMGSELPSEAKKMMIPNDADMMTLDL